MAWTMALRCRRSLYTVHTSIETAVEITVWTFAFFCFVNVRLFEAKGTFFQEGILLEPMYDVPGSSISEVSALSLS